MGFENQVINDMDRERYDFSNFVSKFVHKIFVSRIKKWTVNSQKDIFLVFLRGGLGDSPFYFGFFKDGVYFNVPAQAETWKGLDGRTHLNWMINRPMIFPVKSPGIAMSRDEVFELVGSIIPLLKGAFSVFGFCYSTKKLESVSVSIESGNSR